MSTREATHAGSWYKQEGRELNIELDTYLNRVPKDLLGICTKSVSEPAGRVPVPGARAIIAPHAGFTYSGPAAAWAYKALDWSNAKRIFLLGPSHHYYLSGCALSTCKSYDTPFGPLRLDQETIASLSATGSFDTMTQSADEAEHSLEMHLPYIYKMLYDVFRLPTAFPPLIPILIGATTPTAEQKFGRILAPYLSDPSTFFVLSSDFCHWGSRFRYTYYNPLVPGQPIQKSLTSNPRGGRPIHESIAEVDKECMEACETGKHGAWTETVERTGNTVCGRHPIGVFMAAVEEWRKEDGGEGVEEKGCFRFVRYERSSLVQRVSDSSVSYCSAYAVF